mgnify:CR=1 FL=1
MAERRRAASNGRWSRFLHRSAALLLLVTGNLCAGSVPIASPSGLPPLLRGLADLPLNQVSWMAERHPILSCLYVPDPLTGTLAAIELNSAAPRFRYRLHVGQAGSYFVLSQAHPAGRLLYLAFTGPVLIPHGGSAGRPRSSTDASQPGVPSWLVVVDAASGRTLWHLALPAEDPVQAIALAADRAVVYVAEGRRLHLVALADGSVQSSLQVAAGFTRAVLSDLASGEVW